MFKKFKTKMILLFCSKKSIQKLYEGKNEYYFCVYVLCASVIIISPLTIEKI